MRREFFNQQFSAMLAVYTYAQKLPDEAQDVYWEMLKGIPEDKFHAGIRHCLATCKFFPTISELGEASLPTIERLAPYNPHVHTEPRKVNWQDQVKEIEFKERQKITGPAAGFIADALKGK